MRRHVL